jgi:non-ribosomal peptide synthase protein (TIGR01720 family)
MVPALYVPLESLPLNANGKVDRRALAALPLPAPSTAAPPSEPSGEVEELLAGIWRRVLALEAVGVEDNFFELGGDSILGLRIVAEAHRAGLRLSVRDLFQHQTIAALAPVVERGDRPAAAEQGAVTGAVALTPPQWRFFALELPRPHHYTQSLLLETDEPLRPAWLAVVVRRLLEHHDALRFRYVVEDGRWHQSATAPGGELSFSVVDLAALGEGVGAAVEAVAASTQASLDLGRGPLLRMVYLDLGPHRSRRLLVVVHHLVMDGVSWRILLEDLEAVYRQLEGGGPVALPPKTTSFKEWAERLRALQRSREVQEELAAWSSEARRRVAPLPRDFEDGENLQATASTVVVAVDDDVTGALLQEVPRAGATGVVDVLLAALARALTAWAGGRPVLVDLEDHGRGQELFEEVDLSRTVGWFTSEYPVLLDGGSGTSPGEALALVQAELRRVPRRGLGYGQLVAGELAGEAPARLLALPRSEAIFNYHGQVDQALGRESPFRMAPERKGPAQDPGSRRQHLIEIDASVSGGRLRTSWVYGTDVHREATIRRLAERFVAAVGEVVAHVTGRTSDAYTPADFDLADLNQEQLDAVLGKIRSAGGGVGR